MGSLNDDLFCSVSINDENTVPVSTTLIMNLSDNGKQSMAKWIEICLIGLGVLATALIGYGQWKLGQQQNTFTKQQAAANEALQASVAQQAAELQIIELITPHLELLAVCKADKAAQKMVVVASEYLSSKHQSTVVAEMADALTRECPESKIEADTETRISEATTPSGISGRWFTVIATYRIASVSQAKEAQKVLSKAAKAAGIDKPVEVYLTKISNSYAIVEQNRSAEALRRISTSRLFLSTRIISLF